MKRWKIVLIAAIVVAIATLALGIFVLFFAPRTTYPVYLYPMPGAAASVGAPVYRFGAKIGYVHALELTEKDGPTIELRIYDGMRLYESDVCVIHRLHRYDQATLHIEQRLDAPLERQPLKGDPLVLPCMIGNGPWPKLPGLLEESEN